MSENALALARQHAPCYIYSREILTAQAETLHRTFPGFDILFSVKANPFPPVIRTLRRWASARMRPAQGRSAWPRNAESRKRISTSPPPEKAIVHWPPRGITAI